MGAPRVRAVFLRGRNPRAPRPRPAPNAGILAAERRPVGARSDARCVPRPSRSRRNLRPRVPRLPYAVVGRRMGRTEHCPPQRGSPPRATGRAVGKTPLVMACVNAVDVHATSVESRETRRIDGRLTFEIVSGRDAFHVTYGGVLHMRPVHRILPGDHQRGPEPAIATRGRLSRSMTSHPGILAGLGWPWPRLTRGYLSRSPLPRRRRA